MRKILSFAIIALLTLTVSCNKPGVEEGDTTITPDQQLLRVAAEAHTDTLTYTISNGVDGATVVASVPQDCNWISSISTETLGEVHFLVAANTADESRQTQMTVSYNLPSGETASEFTVNIIQAEAGPEPEMTFEVKLTPAPSTLFADIIPSDKTKTWTATVVQPSYLENYTDEDFMAEYISYMGSYLSNYSYKGDFNGFQIIGLFPEQDFVFTLFGVDANTAEATTSLTKIPFTSPANSETDAKMEANITNYWHIDDLVAYNSNYSQWKGSQYPPVLTALDFTFSGNAEYAYLIIWEGDMTTGDQTQLFQNTIMEATQTGAFYYPDETAQIYFLSYGTVTIAAVAVDSQGNYSELFTQVVELSEEGKSSDYALFDKYLNDIFTTSSINAAPAQQVFSAVPGNTVSRVLLP